MNSMTPPEINLWIWTQICSICFHVCVPMCEEEGWISSSVWPQGTTLSINGTAHKKKTHKSCSSILFTQSMQALNLAHQDNCILTQCIGVEPLNSPESFMLGVFLLPLFVKTCYLEVLLLARMRGGEIQNMAHCYNKMEETKTPAAADACRGKNNYSGLHFWLAKQPYLEGTVE